MRSRSRVPLGEVTENYQFMLADLERSGLTPEDIDVEPLPKNSKNIGYKILYPGHEHMHRTRYRDATPKYLQPKKQHGIWMRSGESYEAWQHADYRLIVEGEKKAAAALRHLKIPAVGIGGCWNWTTGKGECNEWLLRGHGKVGIVMDGDLVSKESVQLAAGGLARALQAAGNEVEVILLPTGEGHDKVGLDDWLVAGNKRRDFDRLPRFPIEKLPLSRNELARKFDLMLTDKGSIIHNYSNTLKLVSHFHGDDIYTDQYLGPFFGDEPYRDEIHDSLLLKELEEFNPSWPRKVVQDARRHLLISNSRNRIGEWLEGLVWDGKQRLPTFFQKYCQATQDPEYLADAARSVFVGMAARCLQPGCKFDLLTTLVGPQGVGKTSLWEELAGGTNLCKDALFTREGDNLARIGANAWIINLDEFAGMSKADARDLKNWLTRTSDTWVPKYVELSRTKDRAFIVVGTTNEIEHLSDTTGNRRFLPVSIGTVDFARVRRDRAQLFAEAVRLYREGYVYWEVRQAQEAQERHRRRHPWEDSIRDFLASNELPKTTTGHRFITMSRAMWEVKAGLSGHAQHDATAVWEMGKILRLLGFEKRRQRVAAIEMGSFPDDVELWLDDKQRGAAMTNVWAKT